MVHLRLPVLALVSLILALAFACSSATKQTAAPGSSTHEKAKLEVTYVLGDNFRHLAIQDEGDSVVARNYLNKKLLKEAKIDRDKFKELLQQASALVNEVAARAVNTDNNALQGETLEGNTPDQCRAPFTITVRTGKTTQSANGCRSSSEGQSFNRFTKEAEFLLYSKK